MWTWMVESMLRSLPFRQENRRLSPNSDILVDFGVPKEGLKPRKTTPGGTDGHETVVKGPPHGPGKRFSSCLSEWDPAQ